MSSAVPPQEIKQRLEAGERLLWWDQPKQGIILRKADLYLIPFSLLWAGFAIFWETMAVSGNAPWFFKLWGVPFVLIGIYILIGRFFYDSWRRGRLYYGLTDSRILIATPNSCRTLTLDTLGEIMLEEGRNGEGTIAFGREPPGWANAGWQPWSGAPAVPSFERIREARQVFAAIRQAQKRRGSGTALAGEG
jgi:hypothetical protein